MKIEECLLKAFIVTRHYFRLLLAHLSLHAITQLKFCSAVVGFAGLSCCTLHLWLIAAINHLPSSASAEERSRCYRAMQLAPGLTIDNAWSVHWSRAVLQTVMREVCLSCSTPFKQNFVTCPSDCTFHIMLSCNECGCSSLLLSDCQYNAGLVVEGFDCEIIPTLWHSRLAPVGLPSLSKPIHIPQSNGSSQIHQPKEEDTDSCSGSSCMSCNSFLQVWQTSQEGALFSMLLQITLHSGCLQTHACSLFDGPVCYNCSVSQ